MREGLSALRRELAELEHVVDQGAVGRAKRADRARIVPELLVLFELDTLVTGENANEPEALLRLVRRGLDQMLR
jgi:hypothetical protein